MEEITPLSQLRPHDTNKVIEVKVYRQWIAKNIPDNTPLGFSYMLLDMMGNAIQANASDMRFFNLVLDVDKAYRIKHFICEPAKAQQRTVDHTTTLKFGRIGDYKNIPVTNFPNHYFNFITYDQLAERAPTTQQSGTKREIPILTDYIGAIHNIGSVKTVGSVHTTHKNLLIIEINNLSNDITELKLWGDQAIRFNMSLYESLLKPVIIAVSSCWVKIENGKPQLIGSPATHCYLNPQIPEFQDSIDSYIAKYIANPVFSLTTTKFKNPEEEKNKNRRTLAFLLSQTPSLYRGREFTGICTILNIEERHTWYYNACKTCRKKLDHLSTGMGCANHGEQEDNYSYCFKAYVTDGSAEAVFTFFETAGAKVTNQSCHILIQQIEPDERRHLPLVIKKLKGTSYILLYEFGSTYPNRPHEFIANDAFEDLSNLTNMPESSSTIATSEEIIAGKRSFSFQPETPSKEFKKKRE